MTAGAVHELLRDAAELVPGVLELEVEEPLAGLRPGTPDNGPVLGASPALTPRWATGHYRNGHLAGAGRHDLVAAEMAGERAAHPFGPSASPARRWRRDLAHRAVRRGPGRARPSPSCSPTWGWRRRHGVAVAVDGEVVPRAEWARRPSPRAPTSRR